MLVVSSLSYFFHKATIEGVRELGFPDFFRIELAVLKLLAVAILLIPVVPLQTKEWAYAGVGVFFITAIIAHFVHKDPYLINMINIFFLGLLVVSNVCLHKLGSIV